MQPNTPAPYTASVYNGSTRFASPISDRSRLIPELEMTDARLCQTDNHLKRG